jgi:hypothetical protein
MRTIRLLKFLSLFFLIACGDAQQNLNKSEVVKSHAWAHKNDLWKPGQTIRIKFKNVSSYHQQQIMRVSRIWTKYANLKFEFYENKTGLTKMHFRLVVKYSSDIGSGGSATLGRQAFFTQGIMTLGADRNGWVPDNTILHEFGHLLGLKHEHQNPNQDYGLDLEWLEKNCSAYIGITPNKRCIRNITPFNIDRNDPNYYISEYDHSSIMSYVFDLPSEAYVTGVRPEVLDYDRGLSLNDRINIAKIYPGKITEAEIRREWKIENPEEVSLWSRILGN